MPSASASNCSIVCLHSSARPSVQISVKTRHGHQIPAIDDYAMATTGRVWPDGDALVESVRVERARQVRQQAVQQHGAGNIRLVLHRSPAILAVLVVFQSSCSWLNEAFHGLMIVQELGQLDVFTTKAVRCMRAFACTSRHHRSTATKLIYDIDAQSSHGTQSLSGSHLVVVKTAALLGRVTAAQKSMPRAPATARRHCAGLTGLPRAVHCLARRPVQESFATAAGHRQ